MNYANYSKICDHARLIRIDSNFVRCQVCGQSMISQQYILLNKNSKDFVNENKSFIRNFDRNFTNELEETNDKLSNPIYEYYTDHLGVNKIIVNRKVQFCSNPPKYEVIVNDSKSYLTNNEIQKILLDINAVKIN